MIPAYVRIVRAHLLASRAENQEALARARQDVQAMLEGQRPQEGADYGPWKSQMEQLLLAFAAGEVEGVQHELALWLYEEVAEAGVLLDEAKCSDGRRWKDVLSERGAEIEEEEERSAMEALRAAKERQMRERLARTTGDSMADEIMAMLREQDLSRTDIYRHYSGNVSAECINDALFVLERLGWARWKTVSTGGRGREVWFLPPDEE